VEMVNEKEITRSDGYLIALLSSKSYWQRTTATKPALNSVSGSAFSRLCYPAEVETCIRNNCKRSKERVNRQQRQDLGPLIWPIRYDMAAG